MNKTWARLRMGLKVVAAEQGYQPNRDIHLTPN